MTNPETLPLNIASAISQNTSAMRSLDRADQFRLRGLTDKLKRYLDRIEAAKPHELPELALLLGPTMRGPAIEDLIRQSEEIRTHSRSMAA